MSKNGIHSSERPFYLFLFSAKTREGLIQRLTDLQAWIAEAGSANAGDIAYTLSAGRSHFAERAAVIAPDLPGLAAGLQQKADELSSGSPSVTNGTGKKRGGPEDQRRLDERVIRLEAESGHTKEAFRTELEAVAGLYLEGCACDWSVLYRDRPYFRIPLPTYPFRKEKYWLELKAAQPEQAAAANAGVLPLGPVLDSNCSTVHEQFFQKKLTGEEFYLNDHIVSGHKLLPGVVQLEMALSAAAASLPGVHVRSISDVVWSYPIQLDKGQASQTVQIHLYPGEEEQELSYEISSRAGDATVIHSRGRIAYSPEPCSASRLTLDIDKLSRGKMKLSGSQVYGKFRQHQLDLGPSFQSMTELLAGEAEAVAFIELPPHLQGSFTEFTLHPTIVDGILEAVIGLVSSNEKMEGEVALPYSFEKMEIYGELPANCVSYVRKLDSANGEQAFDVLLADERGQVLLKFSRFVLKVFYQGKQQRAEELCFGFEWQEEVTEGHTAVEGDIVIFTGQEQLYQTIINQHPGKVYVVEPGTGYRRDNDRHYCINPGEKADYTRLLNELKLAGCTLQTILWDRHGDSGDMKSLAAGTYLSQLFLAQALMEALPKQPVRVIQTGLTEDLISPELGALSGFNRTLSLENSRLQFSTLFMEKERTSELYRHAAGELGSKAAEVRYLQGTRYVRRPSEFVLPAQAGQQVSTGVLRRGAVYVITGGTGKLGMLVARHLAGKFAAKLALIGRSVLHPEQERQLDLLRSLGAEVLYVRADVSQEHEVQSAFSRIREAYGAIHGIIHTAGVTRDALIGVKDAAASAEVLAAKISGLVHLDEATRDDRLEFLAIFSSIAAVTGNTGQSDYAFANAFMDYYAASRNSLADTGQRFGRTVSINWPLWKEGGMSVDDQTLLFFKNTIGLKPLESADGLACFEAALNSGCGQLLMLQGNRKKIRGILGLEGHNAERTAEATKADGDLPRKVQETVADLFCRLMKLASSAIHPDQDLSEYGFNSITFTDAANAVNDTFKVRITPAVFFEYPTVRALAGYLCEGYTAELTDYFGKSRTEIPAVEPAPDYGPAKEEEAVHAKRSWKSPEAGHTSVRKREPIAIIGVSGAMPGSKDLDTFWEHLSRQKDLITEIPGSRWDYRELNRLLGGNKPVSSWGGFMEEADRFDPGFFNINPREADLMDPQQRIFLETVWSTIEDAGYKASALSGKKVGLFVGVSTNDYSTILQDNDIEIEAYSSTGSSHCVLANRISYLFNFRGPSEPIDTACSSSLVAVHRAVESILSGDCDQAIAGGVNVIAAPTLHISFSRAGMLSPDGRCKTFDQSANGYVRGEGTGAVLLKTLSQAEADGDYIYAVIKGTAINHGGKVSSLTVPNPKAQTEVLVEAYGKAGFSPDTIGYIEAHGTGTSLGDPVEINALKSAFKELHQQHGMPMTRKQYCGLGAVKTNIGHLEAAAGIAGILKVVLAMKHRTLPGNVHFNALNPYIELEDSPFYIMEHTQEWNQIGDAPRRAGISSFGFGGVNAHVVLEDYNAEFAGAPGNGSRNVIVLSAKSKVQLREKARRLAAYVALNGEKRALTLHNIAYTLQTGREDMAERIAFAVSDTKELVRQLAGYADHSEQAPLFHGHVPVSGANASVQALDVAANGPESAQPGDTENLEMLMELWLTGINVDWSPLYVRQKGQRIPLPVYPFAREVCWARKEDRRIAPKLAPAEAVTALHPMVDSNVSTMEEEKFRKTLRLEQFFLKDHIVGGKVLLPGVAYLEMVRAAAASAGIVPVTGLSEIRWIKAIELESDRKDVFITFELTDQHEVEFQVFSESGSARILHSTGKVLKEAPAAGGCIDPDSIKARSTSVLGHAECYDHIFKNVGFAYGPAFKVTQQAYCSELEGLSELSLPGYLEPEYGDYELHPSLIDGAVRSVSWVGNRTDGDLTLRVPFALDRMELLGTVPKQCYAYARPSEGTAGTDDEGTRKYDIQIAGMDGQVVVRLQGFSIKQFNSISTGDQSQPELRLYAPEWVETPVAEATAVPEALLILGSPALAVQLRRQAAAIGIQENCCILVHSGTGYAEADNGDFTIHPGSEEDYRQVLNAVTRRGLSVSHILHAWNVQSGKHVAQHSSVENKEMLNHGLYSLLNLLKAAPQKDNSRIRCLYAFSGADSQQLPLHEMAAGFARSIAADHPLFQLSLIRMDSGTEKREGELLLKELLLPQPANGTEIKLDGTGRWTRKLTAQAPLHEVEESRLVPGGVYIITGGTGALGMIVASKLAARYGARLVLAGRQEADESVRTKLKQLRDLGAEAVYVRADAADSGDARRLITQAKASFGRINGIIHCAGIGETIKASGSSAAGFARILAPKVDGTLNLDLASSGETLDLFILFSSTSAEIGDTGAGSYAAANAYMDRYALYRNRLAAEHRRSGHTVSINWPLWKDGRYRMEAAQEQALASYYGMLPLDSDTAFSILESALKQQAAQIFIGYGDQRKIARTLGITDHVTAVVENHASFMETAAGESIALEEPLQDYLTTLLAKTLGISKERFNADSLLDAFGLDSIMILELNEALQQEFAGLPNTLFYEFNTVAALAGYFMKHYPAQLAAMFQPVQAYAATAAAVNQTAAVADKAPEALPVGRFRPKPAAPLSAERASLANQQMDIAVIGMDGRFPMAGSVSELWENLKDGRDCITEIPPDRWDYTRDYDAEKGKKGKIYTKYGGFIDDVDKFDPLFFQMTPRDAELTDPQERLFLECAYHTVEDAGYTRERLARSKVGVFVGVMYGHYQLIGTEGYAAGNLVAPNSSFASIANRVSYLFNFQGPSMAVDTMCSSSLTAIHLACESIRSGESDAAIAGGVNVTIHRNKYVFLCSQRFASSEGKCRAFGEGGDGYVASEGVGAVLLKPLHKAIEDGDHIYGVIKGTAVNSGGKTSGYTVPNPNAQAAAIAEALRKSGVHPRTITSLEAHGTGTSLGDPIEIAGLSKAFGHYTEDRQFCSISSVKSNIGHLESAAGIASVAKVMLQMKHKMLAPSIHTDELNSGIRFEDTPFYVQRSLERWEESPGLGARRAGISSFGAGGANVHLIAEEFVPGQAPIELGGKQLIVLSAKNADRLTEKVRDLHRFLSQPLDKEYTLSNIAFTLGTGREEMEERLAIVAESPDELKAALQSVLDGVSLENVYKGNTFAALESGVAFIGNTPEDQAYIASLAAKNRLERIARLWVLGAPLDWGLIYGDHRLRRVSLPLYPFAKERYWLEPANSGKSGPATGSAAKQAVSALHPLLDSNVSTLREQKFRKRLAVSEFFLRDHVVNGQVLLPGVAYIEMARAAGEIAGEAQVTAVKDIVWLKPVVMAEDFKELEIVLEPAGNGVRYEISSGGEEAVVHSRGILAFEEDALTEAERRFDLDAIRRRCLSRRNREECYGRIFKNIGFDYGPSFQVTDEVLSGELETLARLSLNETYRDTLQKFVLHPALLDGAVRSVAAGRDEDGRATHIPFSLGSTRIFAAIPSECYVYTRVKEQPGDNNQGLNIFDISITDLEGRELVRLEDFIVRPFGGKTERTLPEELLYYTPLYEQEPLVPGTAAGPRKLLVFAERKTDILPGGKLPVGADACIWVTPGGEYRGCDGNSLVINPSNEEDYGRMLKELRDIGFYPTHVLHRWAYAEAPVSAEDLNAGQMDGMVEKMLQYGALSVVYLFKAYMHVYGQQPLKLLFAYNGEPGSFTALHEMVGGFAKSIITLHHKFQIISVSADHAAWTGNHQNGVFYQELFSSMSTGQTEIRYEDGKRLVRKIKPLLPETDSLEPLPLKERGVYLIPGGTGALGMIFAKYLARRYRANVICAGRQPANPRTEAFMNELGQLGGTGLYLQADISSTTEVEAVMKQIAGRFGRLDGIIHCAGTGALLPVTESDRETAHSVMSAKVQGLLNLDLLSRVFDPSLLVLFSSISVELGDLGIGYYAMANSFMDRYAHMRNSLAAQGKVNGRILSINWPLWSGGGFEIPESESAFYSTYLGMKTMEEEAGVAAFEVLMRGLTEAGSVIVAAGNKKKIGQAFKLEASRPGLAADLENKDAIVNMLARLQAGELSEAEVQQWMGGIR